MKYLIFWLLFGATSLVLANPQQQQIHNTIDHFGWRLLQSIEQTAQDQQQQANLLISPLGICLTLAMAMAGAGGETYAQLQHALGFPNRTSSQDELNFKRLLKPAFNRNSTPDCIPPSPPTNQPQLTLANGLALDQSIPFHSTYITQILGNFSARLFSVDFQNKPEESIRQINTWISEKTNGKISNIINQHLPKTTKAVLLNAVHLDAKWDIPFTQITNETFQISSHQFKSIPFLTVTATFQFGHFNDGQLLRLPLKHPQAALSCYLFLPSKQLADPFSYFNTLRPFTSRIGSLTTTQLTLKLPKLSFSLKLTLKPALSQLGIHDAFSLNKANFSQISAVPLALGDVLHQTAISLSEGGAVMASGTVGAMVSMTTSMSGTPEMLTVNRPFLFLIRYQEQFNILTGVVRDPTV